MSAPSTDAVIARVRAALARTYGEAADGPDAEAKLRALLAEVGPGYEGVFARVLTAFAQAAELAERGGELAELAAVAPSGGMDPGDP